MLLANRRLAPNLPKWIFTLQRLQSGPHFLPEPRPGIRKMNRVLHIFLSLLHFTCISHDKGFFIFGVVPAPGPAQWLILLTNYDASILKDVTSFLQLKHFSARISIMKNCFGQQAMLHLCAEYWAFVCCWVVAELWLSCLQLRLMNYQRSGPLGGLSEAVICTPSWAKGLYQ